MPEAAIDEHGNPALRECNVRMDSLDAEIDPVAQARCMQ
jgi:hypothetical protein